MLTFNLSKTVHNVWLQQSKKRGYCLQVATTNDYVRTFKQMMLHYQFKKGGHSNQGTDKNELFLSRMTMSNDPIQLVNAIQKYTPRATLKVKVTHLEGEEIFGSFKWKLYLPYGLEADSHQHDRVNFSHPHVSTQFGNHVCNYKGFPLALINIHTQFLLMGVLKSWKCPTKMDCGTYSVVHQCHTYNVQHCKMPRNVLAL